MSEQISPEELKELCQRIIRSGELGRSRTYAAILEYLAECALTGTNPKEVAIAMDVLGRESDFDVGKDSIVRVHVYHLRNKLAAYFARQGSGEKWRIDIPKGQYLLVCSLNETVEPVPEPALSITGKPLQRRSFAPWLALAAIVMLGLNLLQNDRDAADPVVNPFAEAGLWQPLLDDERPVLVLIGDYYIMGELDDSGNVRRMVREFNINSRQDLVTRQSDGRDQSYFNLDLSYTPTSISNALLQVLRVFDGDTGRVQVKMMSKLSTTDLVGSHIIYLGYLSGLQGLYDLMFAASGLTVGLTYDELIGLDNNLIYTSSSGLSIGENSYRDYGMLSTFPAPGGTQYVLLAGMRDEGLINLAEEVTDPAELQALEQGLQVGSDKSYEALYEVLGYDGTNFDAKLVYSQLLDTKVVWETRLMGGL